MKITQLLQCPFEMCSEVMIQIYLDQFIIALDLNAMIKIRHCDYIIIYLDNA